jgi:hypothetical protein
MHLIRSQRSDRNDCVGPFAIVEVNFLLRHVSTRSGYQLIGRPLAKSILKADFKSGTSEDAPGSNSPCGLFFPWSPATGLCRWGGRKIGFECWVGGYHYSGPALIQPIHIDLALWVLHSRRIMSRRDIYLTVGHDRRSELDSVPRSILGIPIAVI